VEKKLFFSKNLRTWMFAHDITQTELGEQLGMTGTAIGKWILENRPPKGLILSGLCTHIKIDPVEIMEKDLTYQILEEAKYIESKVAEPSTGELQYENNAKLARLLKHLSQVQDELKTMVAEGEKVLESVK